MKVKTDVCEKCRREDCDGKIYYTRNPLVDSKGRFFCKNSDDVKVKDGKLYYHWVMAHGIEEMILLDECNNGPILNG